MGQRSCSHLWSLPKRTLLTWCPPQRLLRTQPSTSASSPPPQRLLIMCSLVLTQLWGAPKFTGRRGEGGGVREQFLLLRSEGCVFFPSPPLILSLPLSFVRHDKKSGGSSEEASQSPSATFRLCWTYAD